MIIDDELALNLLRLMNSSRRIIGAEARRSPEFCRKYADDLEIFRRSYNAIFELVDLEQRSDDDAPSRMH